MSRRSASSTRANFLPEIRSRSRSGSRSAGAGTLSGAIVGAILVNVAKTWLTGAAPETWLFVLGALFVLTTLVFPRGIVGLLRQCPLDAAPSAGSASQQESRRERATARRDTLLYLNGVTVSFDGFKALNELSLIVERGRIAHDHRPERRRQDDDDGRRHRQDPARFRRGLLRGHGGSDPPRRGGDRQSRHRPQISAADRVRKPDRSSKISNSRWRTAAAPGGPCLPA